ncbi:MULTISPECIES: hypothetical protein [unclassified Xanthobacter]|uniref:hypothetical protein n=1 Tax=unclassified Xanthobacter TaxID=2623496 RepID=UPI001EE117F0|nr:MULTISPECIES: hypothetical protein [unclassified Xanthobacter]
MLAALRSAWKHASPSIREWFLQEVGPTPLPPSHLRALRVIAAEVRRHGACFLSAVEVGRRADCSASSVRRAISTARGPEMLMVEPRSSKTEGALPNRIHIGSEAFIAWIERAGEA